MLWDWPGTLERVHQALCVASEHESREASPTAAIIDSQSAKAAQKGGSTLDPPGFDAAKKVTDRKRHILVGTLGAREWMKEEPWPGRMPMTDSGIQKSLPQ
jgi:hypothetical protein